jgi:uncharacterized membrane protein (DUF106 family)
MNIISKEKKEIKWIGLPTSSAQECEEIELQNQQARERIQEKQQQLRGLILKVRTQQTNTHIIEQSVMVIFYSSLACLIQKSHRTQQGSRETWNRSISKLRCTIAIHRN